MLATVVVIPSYLGSVKGYLPLQIGPVLLWVGLPQCLCGLLAMYLLKYIDARLILTFGFTLVAIACLLDARLSSAWSGANFGLSQAIMAVGLAFAFNGMVGAIILEVVNSGALNVLSTCLRSPVISKLCGSIGGEAGAAFLGHFLSTREKFHSNILGLGVQIGEPSTYQRLLGLSAGVKSQSSGLSAATGRAGEILGLQIRQQAFTLAITDCFMLVAFSVVCGLIVIACMAPVPTQYRQVVQA